MNESTDKRTKYGIIAGIIGVISNILLFSTKFTIGSIINSQAMMSDAFNNLSDILSSIITIISSIISNKQPDDEHPFGYGRIEYLAALTVGVIVLIVGYNLTISSIDKIITVEEVEFNILSLVVIGISIIIKIFLSLFNVRVGKKINSPALVATGKDALMDVFVMIGVAASLFLTQVFGSFPIDGIVGLLVALLIVKSGIGILKENVVPLLGAKPDKEIVIKIREEILQIKQVFGMHDLIINNYGPNKYIASVHVEMPHHLTAIEMHSIAEKIEHNVLQKYNILLTIHTDPIDLDDNELNSIKAVVSKALTKWKEAKSAHDFRIINSTEHKNLFFDVVLSYNKSKKKKEKLRLQQEIKEELITKLSDYNSIIHFDVDYGG